MSFAFVILKLDQSCDPMAGVLVVFGLLCRRRLSCISEILGEYLQLFFALFGLSLSRPTTVLWAAGSDDNVFVVEVTDPKED